MRAGCWVQLVAGLEPQPGGVKEVGQRWLAEAQRVVVPVGVQEQGKGGEGEAREPSGVCVC